MCVVQAGIGRSALAPAGGQQPQGIGRRADCACMRGDGFELDGWSRHYDLPPPPPPPPLDMEGTQLDIPRNILLAVSIVPFTSPTCVRA